MADSPKRPDRCETCRYWEPNVFNEAQDVPPEEYIGECHRYPPPLAASLVEPEHDGATDFWPVTRADNWCGEWMPDPAKPVGGGLVMRVNVERGGPTRGT